MIQQGYEHGGDIYSYYEKYGVYPLDFSSSLNPLKCPKTVKKVYKESYNNLFRYPEITYKKLRKAIAEKENVSIEKVSVFNGASELISMLYNIFKCESVLVTAPTFNSYKKYFQNLSQVNEYILKEENDFNLQEDFIDEAVKNRLVIIVNPANPTGSLCSMEFIKRLLDRLKQRGSFLIIDECFMDLSEKDESSISLLKDYDNLLIIKAFTKTYAMAGLRLGYALSSSRIREKIENILPEWQVSIVASECGINALEDKDFIEISRNYIKKEKDYLVKSLNKLGLKVYGSSANYVFFNGIYNDLKERLLEYGILIRHCSNYAGLDERYYRVAVKKHRENILLIKSLKNVLHKKRALIK